MRRWLLLCSSILLLAPSAARAQSGDAHLRWNDCAGKNGASDLTFGCNTNEGVSTLVGSIVPPTGLAGPLGYVSSVHAQVSFVDHPPCDGPGPCRGADMPSWWRLDAAGCRAGGITGSNDFTHVPFTNGTGCENPWGHRNSIGGVTGITYPVVDAYWGVFNDRSIVDVGFDLVGGTMALMEGVEYYAFRLDIDHAGAVGNGACEGCCQPYFALMGVVKLHVEPPGGGGDILVSPSFDPGYVTWNSPYPPAPCGPTPARDRTWGQLKSLYR